MAEFITEGWPQGNQVLIEKLSCTYTQDNDCVESEENGQQLNIETREGGGGIFYHIKTTGWSFNTIEELNEVINNFIEKIG